MKKFTALLEFVPEEVSFLDKDSVRLVVFEHWDNGARLVVDIFQMADSPNVGRHLVRSSCLEDDEFEFEPWLLEDAKSHIGKAKRKEAVADRIVIALRQKHHAETFNA